MKSVIDNNVTETFANNGLVPVSYIKIINDNEIVSSGRYYFVMLIFYLFHNY